MNRERILVHKTERWLVYTHQQQGYLGRCVVTARRSLTSLSDMTDEDWLDFAALTKDYESKIKDVFGATMFNWTCMMNNAYKGGEEPHVHWHVRPRYSKDVSFQNTIFSDPQFGHHYDRLHNIDIDEATYRAIAEKIKI